MRFKNVHLPILLVILLWICSSASWGLDPSIEQSLLQEDWDSIIALIESDESHSFDPVAGLILGHAYLATNQNNSAFHQFLSVQDEGLSHWAKWSQSFLKKHEQNPIALYLFGDAMARNGSSEKAIHYFTLAISQSGNHFHLAQNARGVAYLVNDDLDSAEIDFYLTTKDAPEFADAWANYGNLSVLREVSLGQSDRSLECFNKALAINPDFALAHNGRGSLYFGNGEFELASYDFQKAGQLDPSLMLAEVNEGLCKSYAFQVANLPGLNVKPGTSIERIANMQKAAIQERRDQFTSTAPDQEFSKAIEAISYMDPQRQRAVIDKYGFDKVRSAVELNIAARQVEAHAINQESLKLFRKQRILSKLELAIGLTKFGMTVWGLGKDIKSVTGVGLPKAVQAGARSRGIKSVQSEVEKATMASATDSRTLKTVIDAANPNPVVSIVNSLSNIGDSIIKDQKGSVPALQIKANLQVVDFARANRMDSQFLSSRTPTGGLIATSSPKQINRGNASIPRYQPSPSFVSRPLQVSRHSPAPGGVSSEELARSFVDRGNWPVMTTFVLFYSPVIVDASKEIP